MTEPDQYSPWAELRPYVAPHRRRLLLALAASLLVALSDGVAAKMIQPLCDRVGQPGGEQLLYAIPAILLGLALVKAVGRFGQDYWTKTAGTLAIQDLRIGLFRNMLAQPMRFFTEQSAGALQSRLFSDIGMLRAAASSVLIGALRDTVGLIALVAVALHNDWRMALMAMGVLPLSLWPVHLAGRYVRRKTRQTQQVMAEMNRSVEQVLGGVRAVKALVAEGHAVRRLQADSDAMYRHYRNGTRAAAIASPTIELFAAMGASAVLVYGLQRVMAGAMSAGELLSTLTALMLAYGPAKRLADLYTQYQQALGAADRVAEMLRLPPDERRSRSGIVPPNVRGRIQFEAIDFAYGTVPVLSHFSLDIAPGEKVALVGASGSGKTTLLALLARFYDPQGGRVVVDGVDLRQWDLGALRRHLALVDQEAVLFNDTVRANLLLGRPEASEAQMWEALEAAEAAEFVRALPEGLETRLGDRGLSLSGGQRQRLCIARAILRDAPVLLLDEATSALDSETEAAVQQALERLSAGRTVLMVAHRLATVRSADRILVFDGGRIVEQGSHDELMRRRGDYWRLALAQHLVTGAEPA